MSKRRKRDMRRKNNEMDASIRHCVRKACDFQIWSSLRVRQEECRGERMGRIKDGDLGALKSRDQTKKRISCDLSEEKMRPSCDE